MKAIGSRCFGHRHSIKSNNVAANANHHAEGSHGSTRMAITPNEKLNNKKGSGGSTIAGQTNSFKVILILFLENSPVTGMINAAAYCC